MNNFSFLKNIDKKLYEIISDAEKLYQDEYFEQCITQIRKYAENICKNVLGNLRTNENTFDEMLATLKDKQNQSVQEKEFIDDLYFIKREGNKSAHSTEISNSGIIALECLQRAFELTLNYVVYYKKANSNYLKLKYDTELLITGKKSKKTLAEKYEAEKEKTRNKTKPKKKAKQSYRIKPTETKPYKSIIFKILLCITSIISIAIILTIYLLSII